MLPSQVDAHAERAGRSRAASVSIPCGQCPLHWFFEEALLQSDYGYITDCEVKGEGEKVVESAVEEAAGTSVREAIERTAGEIAEEAVETIVGEVVDEIAERIVEVDVNNCAINREHL